MRYMVGGYVMVTVVYWSKDETDDGDNDKGGDNDSVMWWCWWCGDDTNDNKVDGDDHGVTSDGDDKGVMTMKVW